MSAAKRAALADLAPRWSVAGDDPLAPDALDAAFGRRAPRLLDIGVGTGEATRAWATEHPGHDVVAVELHRPGLAQLLAALDGQGPDNVRVVEGDVTELVSDRCRFAAVRVLFPDPWPKRRHLTRRLVDDGFVSLLADVIEPGGWLHLATDWDDYADQMRAAVGAEKRLELTSTVRPERPETTYERRGLMAGRSITDLVADRGQLGPGLVHLGGETG